MSEPLDLRAIEARYTAEADPFDESALVMRIPRVPAIVADVRDLLAALRAHRAALRVHGAHDPTCDHLVLLTSDPPSRKPCSCWLATLLASCTDDGAARRAPGGEP